MFSSKCADILHSPGAAAGATERESMLVFIIVLGIGCLVLLILLLAALLKVASFDDMEDRLSEQLDEIIREREDDG